ncbi:MAG: hypothetical protein CMI61_01495 [Parvibaculum sp.]|nr:hypothetical protein [Parvibaculum sp.]
MGGVMKNLWSRSAAVLSVASTMVLAGCWESQTPNSLYVEFEKAVACSSMSEEELTSKYMAPGYGTARYVESLVRMRTHPSSAAKLARDCRDWDNAEKLAETKAEEVAPGKWIINGETTREGYFKRIPGIYVAKMSDDKLRIVVGNP